MIKSKDPKRPVQVSDARALTISFEDQGGELFVRVSKALGAGTDDFTAPVDYRLALQVQPVRLRNIMEGDSVIGVACIPLIKLDVKEEDKK